MALSFEEFRQFLTEELGVEGDKIEPETLLFSSGLIDSFSLVVLMTFIENAGEVSIAPSDVTLDNFDSVERMLAYVERTKSQAALVTA
jgi:acyl carrier protein